MLEELEHRNYAGTIDVRDLQMGQFGSRETGGIKRHQQ
jgi:hypothetical protein